MLNLFCVFNFKCYSVLMFSVQCYTFIGSFDIDFYLKICQYTYHIFVTRVLHYQITVCTQSSWVKLHFINTNIVIPKSKSGHYVCTKKILYGNYHILEDLFLASFQDLKLIAQVSLPSHKLASPPCCYYSG